MLDWDRAFTSSNENDMVDTSRKTTQNILSNFTPNQKITTDDKDPHGLILKSNLYLKRKIKLTKISANILIIYSS